MASYGSIAAAEPTSAPARSSMKTGLIIGASALALCGAAGYVSSQGAVALASAVYVPLQPAGSMGTNRAFLGKYDGAGQSTKARTVMLADAPTLDYVPVPDYTRGGVGTNTAFLGAHDGEHVTSARKAKVPVAQPTGATRMGTDAVFQSKKMGQKLLVNSFPITKENHLKAAPPQGYGNEAAPQQYAPQGYYNQQKQTGGSKLFGTNKAFMGKYDGKGQSTKGRQQQLYEWDSSMEGEYLAPSPVLTGEGTNQASLVAPPFQNAFTDETNLGGIPGTEPANVLYPGMY